MAKYMIDGNSLTTIAATLRNKTCKNELLTPEQFAERIANIGGAQRVFVSDKESLLYAVQNAAESDIITLENDIDLGEDSFTILKSTTIDGGGHKLTTTHTGFLFSIQTMVGNPFFKLQNIEIHHPNILINVESTYRSDVTIENATFEGGRLVWFEDNSIGSLNLDKVVANTTAIAIYVPSINSVSILNSKITATSHVLQVEQYGNISIVGSVLQSTHSEFAIVYRVKDYLSSLKIDNSIVENISTQTEWGVAIWVPYRRSFTFYNKVSLYGKMDILSSQFPTFVNYVGYGFLVKNDTVYNLCESLAAALGERVDDTTSIYVLTEAAKSSAIAAGYTVTLDSATGLYIVTV